MEQVSNVLNGFTNLMDQNIRGVQVGKHVLFDNICISKLFVFSLGVTP